MKSTELRHARFIHKSSDDTAHPPFAFAKNTPPITQPLIHKNLRKEIYHQNFLQNTLALYYLCIVATAVAAQFMENISHLSKCEKKTDYYFGTIPHLSQCEKIGEDLKSLTLTKNKQCRTCSSNKIHKKAVTALKSTLTYLHPSRHHRAGTQPCNAKNRPRGGGGWLMLS